MSNVSIESVSDVVGSIYEAAYDRERWLDVLTGLRDLLGGSRACIMRFDLETADSVSTSADPELTSAQILAAYMRDPLRAAATRVPLGAIYKRTQIAGEDFLRRELWQEWFRPRDMYDGLVVNLMSSQDTLWQIDVHRGAQQQAFDATEIDLMQKLMPHVLRAGEISRSIQETSALASTFSNLPYGMLVVDGYQRVCQMNDAAEVMLARPDTPLGIKSGLVAASLPGDALQLQALVRETCLSADGALPGKGGTLLLPSGD